MWLRSHGTVLVPTVLRARVGRLPARGAASFELIATAGRHGYPFRPAAWSSYRERNQVSRTPPDPRFSSNLRGNGGRTTRLALLG